MANQAHFDLVTLGSGSAAFAAALRAQEFGKTSVMTEERTIGGTCANRGCLPSKNLIEAAKLFDDARNPRYPGLSPCPLALDFRALIAQKDEVILDYRKKRYESLVGGQFSVEKGHAQFIDAHTVEADGKRLTGDKVLIATGSRPMLPPIDGLNQVSYLTSDLLTSDEPVELTECPRSYSSWGAATLPWNWDRCFGASVRKAQSWSTTTNYWLTATSREPAGLLALSSRRKAFAS